MLEDILAFLSVIGLLGVLAWTVFHEDWLEARWQRRVIRSIKRLIKRGLCIITPYTEDDNPAFRISVPYYPCGNKKTPIDFYLVYSVKYEHYYIKSYIDNGRKVYEAVVACADGGAPKSIWELIIGRYPYIEDARPKSELLRYNFSKSSECVRYLSSELKAIEKQVTKQLRRGAQ